MLLWSTKTWKSWNKFWKKKNPNKKDLCRSCQTKNPTQLVSRATHIPSIFFLHFQFFNVYCTIGNYQSKNHLRVCSSSQFVVMWNHPCISHDSRDVVTFRCFIIRCDFNGIFKSSLRVTKTSFKLQWIKRKVYLQITVLRHNKLKVQTHKQRET